MLWVKIKVTSSRPSPLKHSWSLSKNSLLSTGADFDLNIVFVGKLELFDSPFEFQSKLNSENKLSDFSEPSNKDEDEDIPF